MTDMLQTDGYKFSMAQAGFPMRPETFYFSFRKGGSHWIPFDLEAEIRSMIPEVKTLQGDPKLRFAETFGYELTETMLAALMGGPELEINAVPANTWVVEREPIVTVTGPSLLVSWLEPLILRLFFPIQLATEIKKGQEHSSLQGDFANAFLSTCDEQAGIIRRVVESVGPRGLDLDSLLKVEEALYCDRVYETAGALKQALDGETNRIFEVGMRAASCEKQHLLALSALQEQGIQATSNVSAAYKLGMTPVGTMGHEHIQRWGDDLSAYRAMRDMRTGIPSYLLDTFDTINSGIPNAIRAMREREHACSVRYDSGDKFGQYVYAHGQFMRYGVSPTHILEDGLDLEMTEKFENLRKTFTQLPPEKQLYGYGGHLVSRTWDNPLTRDRVAAVYKLSETSGEPRMKFGDERGLGKVSVPGRPVAWRRLRGEGPFSIIGQDGEQPPEDYIVLNGNPEAVSQINLCKAWPSPDWEFEYNLSPETQRLVDQIKANKE